MQGDFWQRAPVLRLVRAVSLPRLKASRRFACLRQPGFRAYAMQMEGMRYDGQSLGLRNQVATLTNDATLVLAGTWVDRRQNEHTLTRGQASVGPSPGILNDRWDGDVTLLTIEWDGPRLPPFEIKRLTPRITTFANEWVEVMFGTDRARDVPTLMPLLGALRTEGWPVPEMTPRPPPEPAVRAAAMLNQAFEHLNQTPMWVDFTNQRSERQWRRDLSKSQEWLGLTGGTFRATLNALRLMYAASLLSMEAATTQEVSEALGYGSSRSLLVAMSRAKMDIEAIRAGAKTGMTTKGRSPQS